MTNEIYIDCSKVSLLTKPEAIPNVPGKYSMRIIIDGCEKDLFYDTPKEAAAAFKEISTKCKWL